jgi:hypothetical protein
MSTPLKAPGGGVEALYGITKFIVSLGSEMLHSKPA